MGDTKYIVPWPGYTGPKTPGPLRIVEWPDTHPDTHCECHTFTPDKEIPEMCECGWTEKDTTGSEYLEPLRLLTERVLLLDLVEESTYYPKEILFVGCLEYCARFGYKMEGPLDLEVVSEWIRKEFLPAEMRMLLKKYSRELEQVGFETPMFLEAMEEYSLDLAKLIISTASAKQLKKELEDPLFPLSEDIEAEIHQRIKKLKKKKKKSSKNR